MSTSDLLTRMYAMPSALLNRREQMFMQKLHSMPALPTSATTARNGSYFSASAQTSSSYSDPYLHRVYWLLTNSKGFYLSGISGNFLSWEKSANAVPAECRFCNYMRVKRFWLEIRSMPGVDVNGLSIKPVDFYAHRATPHLWCACDD